MENYVGCDISYDICTELDKYQMICGVFRNDISTNKITVLMGVKYGLQLKNNVTKHMSQKCVS